MACAGKILPVPIGQKHFDTVSIPGDIAAANGMIVMSHFKGHEVSGFGGAIKNLAMGCAPPEGKRAQHQARPFVMKEQVYRLREMREGIPEVYHKTGKKEVHDQSYTLYRLF